MRRGILSRWGGLGSCSSRSASGSPARSWAMAQTKGKRESRYGEEEDTISAVERAEGREPYAQRKEEQAPDNERGRAEDDEENGTQHACGEASDEAWRQPPTLQRWREQEGRVRHARNEARDAALRSLRQEGDGPEAGHRDRFVGSTSQRQARAESRQRRFDLAQLSVRAHAACGFLWGADRGADRVTSFVADSRRRSRPGDT